MLTVSGQEFPCCGMDEGQHHAVMLQKNWAHFPSLASVSTCEFGLQGAPASRLPDPGIVAQILSDGHPTPGCVQGRAGQCLEQPGLMEGALGWSFTSLPGQSVIL